MPIYVRWYIPGRVTLVEFTGIVTEVEYARFIQQIRIDPNANRHGHAILIFNQLEKAPLLSVMLNQALPSHDGWAIAVNKHLSRAAQMLGQVVFQSLHIKFRQASSLALAVSLLQQLDPSLEHIHFPSQPYQLPIAYTFIDGEIDQHAQV